MNNPFSLAFGMEPANYIERISEKEAILSEFYSDVPSNYVYLLTGVRGSGKTVFMYALADEVRQREDWIVANLGPKHHMLEALAAEIYEQGKMKHLFLSSEFSFSFQGFGLSIQGKEPVSDVMSLLKKMLGYLQKKNKKVLVTIDEVDNSEEMKYFVQGCATLLSLKYPLFLLMTGLYENVSKLQNEKSLTFLYRALKIQIGPLPIGAVAGKYSSILKADFDTSLANAKITKGYAYAYQVLGHSLYEKKLLSPNLETLFEFDQRMSEYVYEKVYAELSKIEKEILKSMGEDCPVKISTLAEKLGKSSSYLSVYRDALIKEGVLSSPSYGYVQFALPRFDVFLKTQF